MTTLTLTDWLNFGVASIEAEKTFIGLRPGSMLRNFSVQMGTGAPNMAQATG